LGVERVLHNSSIRDLLELLAKEMQKQRHVEHGVAESLNLGA
jgi:hypothetical protein